MAAPRRGIEAVVVDPVLFGGYWLLDPIAEGRLGAVHRALRRREGVPDEMLAIKRVSPALLRDRRFAERFVDVMAHAAKLRHPAHCTIEDIDLTSDGSLYAALEWVPGRDLGRITAELNARSETMPPQLVAYIGAEIATALAAAHGLSVSGTSTPLYHGELAPPDILIGYDGRVKLSGLESASLQAALRAPSPRTAYQAPELALGDPCSARGDVYSLGACLYELLTGRPAASASARAGALASRRPESHITKVIPRSLEPIVRRALADNPDSRWESAAELARALQKFIAAQPDKADAEALSAFMGRLFEHAQADDEAQLQQWLARVPARESASRPPPLPQASAPAPATARPSYTQLVRANERPQRRPSPTPSAPVQQTAPERPESGPLATDRPRSRPPATSKPQSRPPATRPPPPERPVAEVFDDPAEKTPSKNVLMNELAAEMTDPQGDELRALASSSLPPRGPAHPRETSAGHAPVGEADFEHEVTPAPLWESAEAVANASWPAPAAAEAAARAPRSQAPAVEPEPQEVVVRPSRPSSPFATSVPSISAVRPSTARPAKPSRARALMPVLAGVAALMLGLLGAMLFFRGTQGDPGSVQIETHPSGAEVVLRGESFGAAPLRLEGVPSGSATIELRKAGYESVKRTITVEAGQLIRLNVELTNGDRTPRAAAPVAAAPATGEAVVAAPAEDENAVPEEAPSAQETRVRRVYVGESRRRAPEEPVAAEPVLQVSQAEPPPEPEVAPVAAVAPVVEMRPALRGGMRLPTQLPEREETEPAEPAATATAPTPSTAATPTTTAPTASRGVNRAAVVIEQTTPRFPARAKRRDIVEGSVTVEYTIDPKGAVLNPKVVSSEPDDIFDEAALRAISEWKYQPKLEAGVPVASRQRFTFRFSE